jgi:outer membrane lipoprotein SlyB
MKKRVLALAAAALCGCASIIHGTQQDIGISSSPTGAKIVVDNGDASTTPYVAKLSRKDNHIVKVTMDGYAPAELTLTKSVSGWVWGNIVFGGLVGLAVDAISGGLYNLTPDQLQAALSKQVGAAIAPTKDGVYIVLVRQADQSWTKVGQLERLPAVVGN